MLLLPYWGRFPNYFQFFLESVRRNPSIDFHIITDDDRYFEYPQNVKVTYMCFGEFKAKVESKFDFPLTYASTPYKMCSVRTIWGYALPTLIDDYDWWGYCDCDMIFGDIRHYITDDVLKCYDRVLSRGHLTLYRNDPEINSAFMAMSEGTRHDWRNILSRTENSTCVAYDEWGGVSNLWKEQRPNRHYDEIIFDDVTPRKLHFESSQKMLVDKNMGKSHFVFKYDQGRLFRVAIQNGLITEEQTCYAHFQKRHLGIACKEIDFDHYLVIPNCFIDYEEITLGKLKKWGRKRYVNFPFIKRRFKNLSQKLLNFGNKTLWMRYA